MNSARAGSPRRSQARATARPADSWLPGALFGRPPERLGVAEILRSLAGAHGSRSLSGKLRAPAERLGEFSQKAVRAHCIGRRSAARQVPRTAPRLACADLGACQALPAGWSGMLARDRPRPATTAPAPSPPPDPAKRHPAPCPPARRGVTGVAGRRGCGPEHTPNAHSRCA